jgi:TRAP-type transport system small permease protein
MRRFWDLLDRAFELAVAVCFLAIVVVGSLQVTNRFILNISLSWSEEFQRYGQIWLVFLAIPVAYRRSEHIGVDLIHDVLHARASRALNLFIELLWIVLAAGILTSTLKLMQFLQFQRSPGLDLRMDLVYGALVIGPAYMLIVALRRIIGMLLAAEPP